MVDWILDIKHTQLYLMYIITNRTVQTSTSGSETAHGFLIYLSSKKEANTQGCSQLPLFIMMPKPYLHTSLHETFFKLPEWNNLNGGGQTG